MFFLASCEDWLDVNVDPVSPTEVSPELTLPVALHQTAVWMHGEIPTNQRSVNTLGNILMYNWSEAAGFSWYNDEFLYRANSSTFYDQIFNYAYYSPLKQLADIQQNDPEVYGAYIGISQIMQAYIYQILVDFYGDIPYSEALGRSENPTPAYDEAPAIYDSLLVDLTQGIALIEAAEGSDASVLPGNEDLVFEGDLEAWKQFANTIKLRIITRAAEAKGDAWVSEALATINAQGSGYIDESVTIQPGYVNEENRQNPFWAYFGYTTGADPTPTSNNQATAASDYIIDLLTNTGDPRIDYLYEEPETGHLGVPQGIVTTEDEYGPDLVSNIGPGLLIGADQPSIIFTLAERYFDAAELALRGFNVGNAEELYREGVIASFVDLGVTGTIDDDNDPDTEEVETTPAQEAARYLAQAVPNIGWNASTDKLEAIITQKWLAVNGVTAEQSWFDWVRTGYPENLPVSQEAPNLQRPVRLSYPASEVSGNAVNVPAQPDVFATTIFWAN